LLKYPVAEQVLDMLPILGLAMGMGTAMAALALLPVQNQLALLALRVIVGATLYVLLCWCLRLPSFVSLAEKVAPRLRALLPARAPEA